MKTKSFSRQYGFLCEADKLFPPMIVVKITNMCNLECVHCPHGVVSKQDHYKPTHMEWGLYEKIVDEVAFYKKVIFRLLCDGEPLMHPRFPDMIRLARQKGIGPVNFITNGLRLDSELSKVVLESGVDVVEISLDALTQGTYEKIRKGSEYGLVMDNVHKFIEKRNKMAAKTKIMVSIIDQPEAEAELEAFKKYWEQRADKVITRVYTSIGGLVDDKKMKIDNSGDRWPCPLLWRRFFINSRGMAEFCVEDWYSETVVGDVNKSSIKEIWSSRKYGEVRQAHLARKFHEVPHCSGCRDWKAREWGNDYFSALANVLGKERP